MKKIIIIILTIILTTTIFPFNVLATETSQNDYYNNEDFSFITNVATKLSNNIIAPQYEPECGTGPHTMYAQGWGEIINTTTNTTIVRYGVCAQCSKCNLVIVTQNEPDGSTPLGYYTTWKIDYALTSYYTVIYQSSDNIKYTNKTRIQGISFRYR